jgi:hypothetical protein
MKRTPKSTTKLRFHNVQLWSIHTIKLDWIGADFESLRRHISRGDQIDIELEVDKSLKVISAKIVRNK